MWPTAAAQSGRPCLPSGRHRGDSRALIVDFRAYQLIQEQLVRMVVEITKAQLLTYHLGRLLDQGKARHTEISMAKLNNIREAMKIARMARDILGGRGILVDHHVIRHLCDLEAISTLEGTENIHTLILGEDLTGISAFYCSNGVKGITSSRI